MILGVTGSIGSGKSSVARELAQMLSCEYCNADELSRGLMQKGGRGLLAVSCQWGKRFLLANGELDRAGLRQAIFEDSRIRDVLNALIHPLVGELMNACVQRCRDSKRDLVVEVPLLFEGGWQDLFDAVVTVAVSDEVCIERVVVRDGVSSDQVRKTLAVQMSTVQKIKLSQYTIDNNGTFEQTRMQLRNLALRLRVHQEKK